jgi:hypothetical protein
MHRRPGRSELELLKRIEMLLAFTSQAIGELVKKWEK